MKEEDKVGVENNNGLAIVKYVKGKMYITIADLPALIGKNVEVVALTQPVVSATEAVVVIEGTCLEAPRRIYLSRRLHILLNTKLYPPLFFTAFVTIK